MKKVVILGSGESGLGAATLASQLKYNVFLSDAKKIQNSTIHFLNKNNIQYEENKHSLPKLISADLVVKSPGIPDSSEIIRTLKEKKTPVISEIEFASQHTKSNIIAITGSNGKTTVSNMTYQLLNGELPKVGLAGNIGISFAKSVATEKVENYVVEVSSFQLDDIIDFSPHIAILTSITPDHLDRYQNNFNLYTASKFRIAENQQKSDYFIYNTDEEHINNWLKKHPVKSMCIPFSIQKQLSKGTYIKNNNLTINIDKEINIMPISALQVKGKHNLKNAMAAATAGHLLKLRKETIRKKLEGFQGVEHRLEHVLKLNNVSYINDSKGTNINATYYALESCNANIIWIVGGVDKGNNYSELLPLVNEKVKTIICLGIDNKNIIDCFKSCIEDIYETTSMSECVKIAYHVAKDHDTILLSPACASFDLFKNYEDRGRQFKKAVRSL